MDWPAKLIVVGLICLVLSVFVGVARMAMGEMQQFTVPAGNHTLTQTLQEILAQQKLQIQLQQDNANVLGMKLDVISKQLSLLDDDLHALALNHTR